MANPEVDCESALVTVRVVLVLATASLLEGDKPGAVEPWEGEEIWDAPTAANAAFSVLGDEVRSEPTEST